MCKDNNEKMAAYLKGKYDAALDKEADLPVEERRVPTVCAILTEEGNIFASIAENVASHDNFEGGSPMGDVLQSVEKHQIWMKSQFMIAVVGTTTSIDPETSELIPIDWDYFGLERRLLLEAGVTEVLHICPESQMHMAISL